MTVTGSASSGYAGAAGPGVAARPATSGVLTAVELNRLRWRCRRGMLENDLILSRFLDAWGSALDAAQAAALHRLLDLTDGELWDLLSARAEPDDGALAALITQLRAA